ncbi:hypothetical protein [Zeaxanthinibacter enoshimensis]|uniref:TolB-like protein n=1 Tax=Zeaxanthinibacter enoshimensis TaxID=392009 RepID=A0A4R6TNK4_9FLAO|nr:hypothetical protein [Zeaxanthinibacter enoshimensis]TDQ32690.1 hypothetical protein CLV82_0523 [Zeaxanthinibacter enoshimensis]
MKLSYLALLLVLILVGCNSDDLEQSGRTEPQLTDLTVIGEDLGNVYRYNYRAETGTGVLLNLSEEYQLPPNFLTLRQDGELLTFFSVGNGYFSALQLEVGGNSPRYLQNFYPITGERSVTWGTASASQVFMAYYSPRGSKNLFVQILDLAAEVQADLSIAFNIREAYDPIYRENRLLVPYLGTDGIYKLAVIDTRQGILLQQLDLGTGVPSIFLEESGNIALVRRTLENDYNLEVYDFNSIQLLEEYSFNVNRFFEPGPLQASMVAGRMFYTHFYAQPAAVPFAPAIYDFTGGGNTILDMPSIENAVSAELMQDLRLTFVNYLPGSKMFAVGYYEDRQEPEVRGGILLISEAGELLERITFPFAPSFIMERN